MLDQATGRICDVEQHMVGGLSDGETARIMGFADRSVLKGCTLEGQRPDARRSKIFPLRLKYPVLEEM